MNIEKVLIYVVLILLLITAVVAMYRFKGLDTAGRIFAIYVIASLASESVSAIYIWKYHNNSPVYDVYSLVEFGILGVYFNNIIDVFRKYHIGIYIGLAGILLGAFNILYIQGIERFNSYFNIFEGVFIIGMSLFYFFRLLIRDDVIKIHLFPAFWLTATLCFFWCGSFIVWSMQDYVVIYYAKRNWILYVASLSTSIIAYLSILTVFILYPKMQRYHD